MANTLSPNQELLLWRYAILFNILKNYGLLTNSLVTSVTSVSDLIADMYAALESGGIGLYGPEARFLVNNFEQGIRYMETLGLIDDTIAAALTTVNTASAATDLRYLISSLLSDANLDVTMTNDPGSDLPFAYSVTP